MAEEHVRGRMPTESNPGNRKPAIPPVFDTTGEEDYRRVTPDNPLPTKDKDLDERLTAIENKLDSVIENGAINTQLTGSNIEQDVNILNRVDKYEIINLFDSVTLTPNETKLDYTDKLGGGATEIWILINSDKNKWGFRSNNGPQIYGTANMSRPNTVLYGADDDKYANSVAEPLRGLWVMSNHNNPTTFNEIYYHRQIGGENIRVGITNNNTEDITMSVKALKVWRY